MEAVVVSATQGALKILLGKLGDVLAENYVLLGGVREEIQELKDELESMTACLRDQASGDDDSRKEQMRIWMKQVREVGYDAEDCIDIFCHNLSKHSGDSRGLARCMRDAVNFLRTLKVRNKLATEIQSLKSHAQKVSDRRLRYKLDAAEANSMSGSVLSSSSYVDVDRRLPALHGNASRLVGMDDKVNSIVSLLNDDGVPHLRTISIVGFGGLGKTSLAMTVYTSPMVRGIQCRAFVPVSQTYDLQSLLESLVRQLVPRPINADDPLCGIESWGISKLIEKSLNYLKDKRYLVILDDVWRPVAWENLKIAFPDKENGSRIVVTTRSHQVARSCCTSSRDCVFEMPALSLPDSEELLFKTVFGSEEYPKKDLEDVSKAILKKCNGLPLAIVSIGGMLAQSRQNKTVADWQRVIERLPSELETNPTLDGMRRILSLSYNDLPYHLKACFLYLSVYPEDHEIRRGALVRRWAAEGFVSALHQLSLEGIAQRCFDEFVSRNIVTPEKLASSGGVRSFKVHDIMLEAITSKSIQENFISFVGNSQHNTLGHDRIRRLSIQPGNRDKDFSSRSSPHLRSLTILGSTERPAAIRFTDLTLLRVLDLEGCHWLSNQDLKDICKLSLLRYLSLRGTAISQLPDIVGKLKGLMTLDLRHTSVRDLPGSITQLQSLNHLLAGSYVHYTRTHSVKHFSYREGVMIPPGLSNMKALRRISNLDVSRSPDAMHEVANLSQLTRLCAINTGPTARWGQFGDSLCKLSSSLRYLSVVQCGDREQVEFLEHVSSAPLFLQSLHLVCPLSRLPPWISLLINLTSVSLRETHLMLITVLGELPNLVSLKLYTNSYMEKRLCLETSQFPRLKQLVLDNLRNLDELSFQGGAPNLERLTLCFVELSARRVTGIRSLEKLREAEFFSNIVDSLVEEVRAVAKDHPNHPRVIREDRPTYEASSS